MLSEIKNDNGKATRRTCLVRQHYFNMRHVVKNDPAPRHDRSRKVAVEMFDIDGSLHLRTLCDCGYVQRDNHSCGHYQCTMKIMPSAEFFDPKLWISYFKLMLANEEHTKIVEDMMLHVRHAWVCRQN